MPQYVLACSLMIALLLAEPLFGQAQPDRAGPGAAAVRTIRVDPPIVELDGPDAEFHLLVDGQLADGQVVDLTGSAQYRAEPAEVLSVDAQGVVRGQRDGAGVVHVEAAGHRLEVPVRVTRRHAPRQLNFARDVEPVLSRFGCNASGCHGKAEGQNGFKLSVFGSDPQADYDALVSEGRGRRVFPADPPRSLLLQKASGEVPHGGGWRIGRQSWAYDLLREWIAAGMPLGSDGDPQVTAIELVPSERILKPGQRQQLRVMARFSDGRLADATRLARFQSNNEGLATVDEAGRVTAGSVPGQAAVMASFMGSVATFTVLVPQAEAIDTAAFPPPGNFIDGPINRHLAKLNILPSPPADDATFLQRVYLDVIGRLPTAGEARTFLADGRPDRRARLVDSLLTRPEYADYWALKWSDLLRVDRRALGHRGAYEFYSWIRRHVAANTPYDAMVRELITAEGPLAEQPQGQFYRVVNQPGAMASTLCQVFLGVRIACAQCHHHPADRWSQTDYYGMQAFFAQVQRRNGPLGEYLVAEGNPATHHPRSGAVVQPFALGTTMPEEPPAGDRRRVLAEWFTAADNPWFARNLANRMLAHFLGRGVVEPVDDFRATNPPSNPELLDALAAHLVDSGFNVQAVIRAVTASAAYQRSSVPLPSNERDEQNFSRALLKRIPAEVLFDAVCDVTGVPEKFDGVPAGYRAVQLWDSDVSHDFLKLFGRPIRITPCECERNTEPSIAQVLHLLNSPSLDAKIGHEAGTVARLAAAIRDDVQLVDELYLTYYSRFPSDTERQAALEHLQKAGSRRRGAEDLAWSLLNSLEFVFNH